MRSTDFHFLQAGIWLHDYQITTIERVEQAIISNKDRTQALLATATGIGKTILDSSYHLVKTKWFKRILFLRDRTALGKWRANAFKENSVGNLRWLSFENGSVDDAPN